MLKDIDYSLFSFESGFLCCQGKKIDLTTFVQIAEEESAKKQEFLKTNNQHNLTNVTRTRSEMGVFSDYPHYYQITTEGAKEPICYAIRNSENGEFILSSKENIFCKFGPNFIGIIQPNFAGTHFDLFDWGLEAKQIKDLPKSFMPLRRRL